MIAGAAYAVQNHTLVIYCMNSCFEAIAIKEIEVCSFTFFEATKSSSARCPATALALQITLYKYKYDTLSKSHPILLFAVGILRRTGIADLEI